MKGPERQEKQPTIIQMSQRELAVVGVIAVATILSIGLAVGSSSIRPTSPDRPLSSPTILK